MLETLKKTLTDQITKEVKNAKSLMKPSLYDDDPMDQFDMSNIKFDDI